MIARGQVYSRAGTAELLLVVSSDAINRLPLVVTVVPGVAGHLLPHDYPTNVRIPATESGVDDDVVFLCFRPHAIDPADLVDPATHRPSLVATISTPHMQEVEAALRRVLDL